MKTIGWTTCVALLCMVTACTPEPIPSEISNQRVATHEFLQCMAADEYYPSNLVDKGKDILLQLAARIEQEKPQDEDELYALTHTATNRFNDLSQEFYAAGGDFETVAAECVAADFAFLAEAYGFRNADLEELIATRTW